MDAVEGSPAGENWIEIYHSKPRWRTVQISYQKGDDAWVPFGRFKLIDASNVRPGFRAFRIQAQRLEFRLSDAGTAAMEPADGTSLTITSPGRYVLEGASGMRRVGDADVRECLRALRPDDRFAEIRYAADPLWRKCFLSFAPRGAPQWVTAPMRMADANGTHWSIRAEVVDDIEFAFTDGGDEWDNNADRNYALAFPGMYSVAAGQVAYLGPAAADMHAA